MCDTLCVPADHGMWFAKNSDRPTGEIQAVVAHGPRSPRGDTPMVTTQYLTIDDPGPTMPVVLSQPTWLWGAEHAVNAAGVAIGNEKVWTTEDPRAAAPALLGMDLVRLAAERASTADAAVDLITSLLERWGQGGSGEQHADEPYWSSFLVVDALGGWVVETSGRTWVAEPVGGPRAISNRIGLSTTWTRSSADVAAQSDWQHHRDPNVPTGIADHRLAATTAACHQLGGPAAAGPPHDDGVARGLVATLRDHGDGPWGAPGSPEGIGDDNAPPPPTGVGEDWSGITVCMHVADYQCTTASMVASLPDDPEATIRLWASIGPACCAIMLPGAIVRGPGGPATVIPDALGDETLWRAASHLARQAEQAPVPQEASASITRARRVLGSLEADAWEEATELAGSVAPAASWQQAAERWSDQARSAARLLLA